MAQREFNNYRGQGRGGYRSFQSGPSSSNDGGDNNNQQQYRQQDQRQGRDQYQSRNNAEPPKQQQQQRQYKSYNKPKVNNPAQGVPKPSHLSKEPTPANNDPLFLSSVLPLPGMLMMPTPGIAKMYPGFEGLTEITKRTYQELKAESNNFGRKVSESAFSYYSAVNATARLIRTQIDNGFETTSEEDKFVENVENLNLNPPNGIATYINGIGNTTAPLGRQFSVSRVQTEYTRGEGNNIPGYFGRINENSHFKYAAYPCLAVYAQRIKQDMLRTLHEGERDWNLPVNIRPQVQGAGQPTENMLGWQPAETLKDDQIRFLHQCGYDDQGDCRFRAGRFPLNYDLLVSIQSELDVLKATKSKVNKAKEAGSQAQIMTTVPIYADEFPILKGTLMSYSAHMLPVSVAIHGLSTTYRVKRLISRGAQAINNWCIYDFTNFTRVPNVWKDTANRFRDLEPTYLNEEVFQVGPYDLATAVERFRESYMTKTVIK